MNEQKSATVIQVPPRRKRVLHRGMHGWLIYAPATGKWHWTFKAQFTVTNGGVEDTEAAAELELKKFMEAAAISKNITSLD